jgi:hypothetical protein
VFVRVASAYTFSGLATRSSTQRMRRERALATTKKPAAKPAAKAPAKAPAKTASRAPAKKR